MQNRKRDTDVQNRLLDSVGEGKGWMFLSKFLNVQAGFRKGRGARDQIANICRIREKAREFQKNICFTDYAKAFDCGSQQTGKFFKRWEYHTILPAS